MKYLYCIETDAPGIVALVRDSTIQFIKPNRTIKNALESGILVSEAADTMRTQVLPYWPDEIAYRPLPSGRFAVRIERPLRTMVHQPNMA